MKKRRATSKKKPKARSRAKSRPRLLRYGVWVLAMHTDGSYRPTTYFLVRIFGTKDWGFGAETAAINKLAASAYAQELRRSGLTTRVDRVALTP